MFFDGSSQGNVHIVNCVAYGGLFVVVVVVVYFPLKRHRVIGTAAPENVIEKERSCSTLNNKLYGN